ncbi:Sensor histidine kinase RcsC [Brevundimonas sp. NIBR11]|nr:Sensor histidine kinase RcsC [Brevundimonas sp. NIBR11]
MPDISYARLETPSGLLAETGGGARLLRDAVIAGDGRGLSLWSVLTTGSIQVTAPVLSEGQAVGSITLFSRVPELRSRVMSTLWTSLAGAMVAVVAGLLVAARMGRQISRPIVDLADFVRTVHTSGDYRASPAVKADGEIGDLIAGFQQMMAGIRDRDARIAHQVETLESEVAARTEDLVVARDEADRANAAKSDFLAVMSHEIRTPLNGILALSDLLAKSDLPSRQQRYAGVIAKSGHSLLSIINDILDFSKVEAGKMDLEAVEVDLLEIAEDVASLFSEKAASKGLDLAVYVDPRLGWVIGDPTRLRQVISNLVNNAIKFTEQGGVLIAIDRTDAGTVRIAIEDTGPGIPADKLPGLFAAFSQADQSTSRKFGGTGLGLAICDRLVRAMDGEWNLQSDLGRGSTFAFTAPLAEAKPAVGALRISCQWRLRTSGLDVMSERALTRYAADLGIALAENSDVPQVCGPNKAVAGAAVICPDEASASAMTAARPDVCCLVRPVRQSDLFDVLDQLSKGERPRLRQASAVVEEEIIFPGARVLVVDDSEVNREVAREALLQLGVDPDDAVDGVQAVELLRNRAYDLVLMDGSMPELDGFEATRIIREEERVSGRARAAIVALTAHVVGSGAEAWRECGMDGVIHKPFRLPDLVRELTRHCGAFAQTRTTQIREPITAAGASVGELFDPVVRGELLAMAQAGKSDFVDRIHRLYADNAPLRMAELRAAAKGDDLDALARAAHALKSMSLSLGASSVAQRASLIEAGAREGRVAPGALEQIEETLSCTLAAMGSTSETAEAPEQAARPIGQKLRTGIAEGHLHLAYQTIVDRSGAASGKVEALIRWIDPTEGRMSPDIFIPELERSGDISALTDFVLARALQDMRGRDLVVGINVSATEFQAPGFDERVWAAAQRAGYPPEKIEIEVTETAMLDVEAARRTIDALAVRGIGVALDDFGAGFTSLHALRELKFRTLKVDKSFVDRCVEDTASAAIIHAVIGVGRALGMKVVCEGVETAEQAAFLKVAGAHYMQGFHFHRPVEVVSLAPITAAA